MSVTNRSGNPSRLKSKNFAPIEPHGVLGKIGRSLLHELLSADVLVEVIVALHVQDVEVREGIAVHIRHGRVTGPRAVGQFHLPGHLAELSSAKILVKQAHLGALGIEMPAEGVAHAQEKAAPAFFVSRCTHPRAKKQIEQPVPIEIEETPRPRNARHNPSPDSLVMSRNRPSPRFLKSTLPPLTVVTNRSGAPFVVNVGEGRGDVNPPSRPRRREL